MTDYQYTLDASAKKFSCPACGQKRFVKYLNSDTTEYLPDEYGRCDREQSCGYHLNPYEDNYGKSKRQPRQRRSRTPKKPPKPKPKPRQTTLSTIPYDIFQQSRTGYNRNHFIAYLLSLFDVDTVQDLIAKYHIGTSKHWPGSTIFWQIDTQGKIRTGKIMQYNPETGKRVKNPPRFTWVHTLMKEHDFQLQQCYFGSHLLQTNDKPIALVESEKTAIIASVYFPDFIWIATGGKSLLKAETLKQLPDRAITLFPDIGAFQDWEKIASPFSHITVSDYLEYHATDVDKVNGYDLADYLVSFDVQAFQQRKQSDLSYKPFDPDDPQHNGHMEACDCDDCVGTDPDLRFPFGANVEEASAPEQDVILLESVLDIVGHEYDPGIQLTFDGEHITILGDQSDDLCKAVQAHTDELLHHFTALRKAQQKYTAKRDRIRQVEKALHHMDRTTWEDSPAYTEHQALIKALSQLINRLETLLGRDMTSTELREGFPDA